MSIQVSQRSAEDEEDDEELLEETHIEWSNLIFLPFHPVFKLAVLFSVIVKSILGPIQSVYPIVYCSNVMDRDPFLFFIKYFYWYCCDAIYGVDTFLHIVHRQVTDKAMRREYLPKSAFLLLLDLISLIPFFRMVVSDICPPTQLWPNILAFTEFVIIYRVVEYFSLVTTHSFWKMLTGFLLMMASCINCATCFWLLLTKHGLCGKCAKIIYDWRHYVIHKLNETDEGFATYIYGASYVLSFAINKTLDETKPSTILEFFLISTLMISGYLLEIFVVMPKLFAEAILRLRRICTFHPQINRLIQETRRRNPAPTAHVNVENFYKLMWKKRSGITCLPEVIAEFPRYLRLDIKQDLVWPVFYHSPTLRKTSSSFKRWLCDYIRLDYKLPGEKFFAGPHCHTNLYYIKSGIVQILSADDGTTSILSVTGGTVFGDVSFLLPPWKRKVIVRCLTYCEIFFVSRYDLLKAMHRFPEDRRKILASTAERIKHARTLYVCKQHVRGLDRAEDEGVAWVKRRWWEISDAVANWKKRSGKKDQIKCELPPEEAIYHCAKYIGQLVLCNDVQLQTKSMFANVRFPWILVPQSSFVVIWHRIVIFTVLLVLVFYPPNITRPTIPPAFKFLQFWTDFVYVADICVSLMTSVSRQENITTNFATVMFARCKSLNFLLDVLSTLWIENLALVFGKPDFYYIVQFNRLIKIYILFTGEFIHWDVRNDPLIIDCYKIALTQFSFVFIMSYITYVLARHIPQITTSYFFGDKICSPDVPANQCDPARKNLFAVAISWTFELIFFEYLPSTLVDMYVGTTTTLLCFMIYVYCETRFIAALYLKYREITNYQYFVSNLKNYYKYYRIHQDLLKRLDRYLTCHWKYYHGVDVMHPDLLKNEPYDIYWKVHGEIAEKLISESKAFTGADSALIRELAYTAKFLILPKNSALFLFGVQCKNVTWIAQGYIKGEYHNEEGELVKIFHSRGHMLSVKSVFLGRVSLRTYTAYTECEILYIRIQDFFNIIKRYPNEWMYFENCIQEFRPVFDEMCQSYVRKHRDYQNKIRDRIFHSRMSVMVPNKKPRESVRGRAMPFESDFWKEPESDFMEYWMLFRAIIVFVSIASASLQGGIGAIYRWPLIMIGSFCDCIAWMDIVIKLFLAYYDERGLLIYDKRKCMIHYLLRGFLLDVIGAFPLFEVLRILLSAPIDDDDAMLVNTFCKFAHLYILYGYFNYIADVPTINVTYIMILKWQVILILVMLGGSHYLMSYCVDFVFDSTDRFSIISIQQRNSCWVPKLFKLKEHPSFEDLHLLFAESLNLVQCGFTRLNFGNFNIDRIQLGVGTSLFFLGCFFWFVFCYSLALLLLNSRGNSLFQHGVSQLRRFLHAERVDEKLIHQTVRHFRYWWIRTKGINIHHLTNERIGVVFRQDLNYYFFKKTFTALDTLLQGGESLLRQLASTSTQIYFLPGGEITREMDLAPWVFVVHRGRVTLSQGGEKIATLTKGGIFGQLDGTKPRPVRISAVADDYADLLQITIKQFQDLIPKDVKKNIEQNPQFQNDFMATKRHFPEDAHDTVQYILQGRKTIKLPGIAPMEARHGNWYSRWLYVVWLGAPFASAFIVLILNVLPIDVILTLSWVLFLLDVIHLAHFIGEFYTMEKTIVNNKCVYRTVGPRVLKRWGFYTDALSLIIPMLTIITDDWRYQLARLLRLRLFYDFQMYFCTSFKSKAAPILMKFIIVILLLHAATCGWIYVACRSEFPIKVYMPLEVNKSIDHDQWATPDQRYGGCARVTKYTKPGDYNMPSFVVPKNWQNDYIVAMTYIILIHTHTAIDAVIPLSLSQVYYKVVLNMFIYLIDMWTISIAISAIYTKFRELYQYDYYVNNLTTYLNHSGLSPSLLESVKEYTEQLWRRQRGNWLPELAQQAPPCLREDLLDALYMHHLMTPPLFRQLPHYFTRQLVARLHRIVVFPGKCLIQEGDIFSCIYFIHEGEVEKWFIDKGGENKMISLLSVNGYFGFIPGLFPNTPFQFTYFTRTVVDLVYLRLKDWQDLLDCYPDVKRDLYTAAKQLKKDMGK
ncbi:uncharacterized protein LOC115440191 [Manduca sexta]|uniref:uncharacterized protein LOC115440191 n=1 Tax=Manduca sexta TaxID=7130 RepID=UPI00188E41D2|nr:uncharacterized protein LOC115440191 [Manduca sexta]